MIKKKTFTYSDLDPGDSRNPMMCRWNSQIISDCDQQFLNSSHPLSPSPTPPSGAPPTSHTSFLITVPIVAQHMAIQGCFITIFFDINYWHLFYSINPSLLFLPALLSPHILRNTSLPKNVPFFLPDNNLRNPFPALSIVAFLLFDNPCQLFISKD